MMNVTLEVVAIVAVGGLWGGMVFFAAVFAPLVFTKLEAAAAGRFIRQAFPVYYQSMGATSAVATVALALGSTHRALDTAAMALVCAGFWLARRFLMPLVNRARDASLAGDERASRRFHRLHRASVVVNGVQLIAVLVVLARFARA